MTAAVASVEKPPFALPAMADVARARGTSGLKVVSTFSGCGGSCLGFEMAGYEVVWSSEFVEAARETYAANHPGVPLDSRDIREVRPEEILEVIGMKVGEVDVLQGSPPCASFSVSGKRERDWGKVKAYSDTKQRTDDLFFEFARILKGLQPRAFVAENVAGLVRGTAFGYFKQIMSALSDAGYRVECRLLDAQWLGVPQTRNRAIFVGVRKDLEREPVFPQPLPYRYSLREAIPSIGSLVGTRTNKFKISNDANAPAPAPAVTAGGISAGNQGQTLVVERNVESFEGYAIEREWKKLGFGEVSRKYLNLARSDPDAPSYGITATGGQVGAAGPTHPYAPRKFTIDELRRICAFPADFVLTGTYKQQWERLGRAVPPRMMFYVARALREGVFRPLGLGAEGLIEAP